MSVALIDQPPLSCLVRVGGVAWNFVNWVVHNMRVGVRNWMDGSGAGVYLASLAFRVLRPVQPIQICSGNRCPRSPPPSFVLVVAAPEIV